MKNVIITIKSNLIPEVQFKNLKDFQTHDGFAYSADLFLNGKKAIHVYHEGRGGEVMFDLYDKTAKDTLDSIFRERKVRELMISEGGYDFVDNPEEIYFREIIDQMVNEALDLKDLMRTVNRLQKKGIVILNENSFEKYKTIAWKSTLKDIVDRGRKSMIQKRIDELKPTLQDGEFIANTNLEDLGIVA